MKSLSKQLRSSSILPIDFHFYCIETSIPVFIVYAVHNPCGTCADPPTSSAEGEAITESSFFTGALAKDLSEKEPSSLPFSFCSALTPLISTMSTISQVMSQRTCSKASS